MENAEVEKEKDESISYEQLRDKCEKQEEDLKWTVSTLIQLSQQLDDFGFNAISFSRKIAKELGDRKLFPVN
jgi:hypothetical protein